MLGMRNRKVKGIVVGAILAAVTVSAAYASETIAGDGEWRSFWARRLVLQRSEQGTLTAPGLTTTTTTAPPPISLPSALRSPEANPPPHPCDLVERHSRKGLIHISNRTMKHCPDISPYFDPWDLEHILLVVECESNGDSYANDHWREEGRSRYPIGLFSHMSDLYKERSLKWLGYIIDPYNTRQAAALAARLLYEPKSDGGQGWGAWLSCHRKDGYAIQRTLDA